MIIAVFRSRVAKEHGGEFERRYAEMSALVEPFLVTEAMSGFLL